MTLPSIPLDFPRKKVGLCMIVKNEARALGRCLESVRGWVGEMVVVDTGSTDETVAIAEAHGARVSHFPWCDDFSAARNAALSQATREWVLVLDGDETCAVDDPTELAMALQQSQWDGFSLPISSLNDDGTNSKAMVFRLFRRTLQGMRYRGEIHEQLEAVAAGTVKTSTLSCIRLEHDGYTAAVVASGDKANRNIRLSRKVTQSRPEDPFSWFVYAMAIAQSDPDGMLRAAQTAFGLLDADPLRSRGEHYVVNLYLVAISVHQSRGNAAQVIELADRALTMFPDSPDLHYQRGSARIAVGDFAGAAEDLHAALSDSAAAFKLVVDPAAVGFGARTRLGHALRHLGRGDEAMVQLRTAMTQAPTEYADAHAELGALFLDRGAIEEAVSFFEEAYRRRPAASDVAFKLGWCLHRLARFEKAEAVLRDQIRAPQVDLLLARVLLDTGRAEQALALLIENELPASLLTLGWVHFVLGHLESAGQAWDAWLAQVPDDNGSKTALVQLRRLLGDTVQVAIESKSPGEPPREMDAWVLLLLRYQRSTHVSEVIRRGPLLGSTVWPRVRMRWAQAMVVDGFVDSGMALLFDAAQEAPHDGAVYYWLGYCAVLRQQADDARVMFEECLRLDPTHPQVRQALALLK
jgi:tetratricopeptide (TPR) repeat protein